MTRSPVTLFCALFAFILTATWLLPSTWGQASVSLTSSDNILDVQNATLGFQKIFVMNIPSRTDKRDAIALGAFFSELEIDFIDAVNGSDVPLKAYPQDWQKDEPLGSIGCWRAHMNVYQKIVRERIQSALILEDDADWDVMIKSQMLEIARGARYVQEASGPFHSPYGDSWDALFLGHCGTNNRVDPIGDFDSRYWVINNDPTVIPPHHAIGVRAPNQSPPPINDIDNRTRIVFSPYKVTCLQAYGVSLNGASRILYNQALRPRANVIDRAISLMCKYRQLRIPIAVHPPIVGQFRQPGDGSKDSDRTVHPTVAREVGLSENVNFPMRLNLESFIYGEQPVRTQWPNDTVHEEIDPSTLRLPTGWPAIVRKDEFVFTPET